ncbi:MAG: hypothetical protein LJF04_19710, partial [Gemmatimonadetes bacterium]|nr:hypothetical protein [Gemmatimonadota bacterium]
RGLGLFLGIEIIAPPDARERSAPGSGEPTPDRARARYVVERMKEKGILLSTDGPDDNVIKIKPPLPFSSADAACLVGALDEVLAESFVADAHA